MSEQLSLTPPFKSTENLPWVEIDGEVLIPDGTGDLPPFMPQKLAEWLLENSEPFASRDRPGPTHPQHGSVVEDILPWCNQKPATTKVEQHAINMAGIAACRATLEKIRSSSS